MGTRKVKLTTPRHNELMALGTYKDVPHYSVIGDMCSFYLWRNTDGRGAASNWLKGRAANDALSELRQARVQSKEKFIQVFDRLYEENRK